MRLAGLKKTFGSGFYRARIAISWALDCEVAFLRCLTDKKQMRHLMVAKRQSRYEVAKGVKVQIFKEANLAVVYIELGLRFLRLFGFT